MSPPPPDLASLRIQRDATPAGGGAGGARRGAWVALVVAAALAAGGWAWWSRRPVEVQAGAVSVTGGAPGSGGSGLSANGYVVARTQASVSAMVAGRLAFLGVSEGSTVRRGDVIARIEDAQARAELAAARARLAEATARLDRARRALERTAALAAGDVSAAAELEDARSEVEVLDAQRAAAAAQVRVAEVALEDTRVRAPFDGTVLRKDAEVGEMVAPSGAGGGLTRTAIATMADLGTLEVEVDVNEAYIARIRGGQKATIALDAWPDDAFRGEVRQVVPTADRQKATVLVKVAILDRDPRILPEMGARVAFESEAASEGGPPPPRRVSVPAAAVVSSAEGRRVFVIEGDAARARPVELGSARGEQIDVVRGLSGGENVVLQPPAGLADGAKVRVSGP